MSQPVFLDYDRAALDLQLNNRATIPGFAEKVAWWLEASPAARAALPAELDLPYGASPAERLDVFGAGGSGSGSGKPVQIFFHGGYWHMRAKEDFSFVARPFVEAGGIAVIAEYGLIPTVTMGELLRQCREAVRFVHRTIAGYGGDPGRLYISGHSAGGHIVAMLLATDWVAAGLPADAVKGAVAISGLYDLEPIRLSYLNDVLAFSHEDVRHFSPVHNPPRPGPALAVLVGGRESAEYHRQAEAWRALAEQQGLAPVFRDLDGHDHITILREFGTPGAEAARLALAQMGIA